MGEASATFVAIVSAFFTTKILSLSADKRRLRNQIDAINSELEGRYQARGAIEELIDSMESPRAKARIDTYLEELLEKEFDKIPSTDELQDLIQQEKRSKLNRYEIEALKQGYDEFKKKLEKKIAERKAERKKGLIPLDFIIPGISERLKRIRLQDFGSFTIPMSQTQINRRTQLYDELFDEEIQIGILEKNKQSYERELSSITFPRFIKFGFASQVYFAIVGVAVPFSYGSWAFNIPDHANIVALGLFLSGLAVTFTYIGIEMARAIKEKVA